MENTDKIKVHTIETEAFLNGEILRFTIKIKNEYPELSKFIEEMPVTIPNEKDPEVTCKDLKSYYETLKSVIVKFELEKKSPI